MQGSLRRFVAMLVAACPAVSSAAGQPDPSFGDDGLVIVHADYEKPVGEEYLADAIVDRLGRYVDVGYAY